MILIFNNLIMIDDWKFVKKWVEKVTQVKVLS
jgi:hypothetical protein